MSKKFFLMIGILMVMATTVFADSTERKQTGVPGLECRLVKHTTGQQSHRWEFRSTNGRVARINVTDTFNMENCRLVYRRMGTLKSGQWNSSAIVFEPIDQNKSWSYNFDYEVVWQ